jgi:hypothetical protein
MIAAALENQSQDECPMVAEHNSVPVPDMLYLRGSECSSTPSVISSIGSQPLGPSEACVVELMQ